MPRRSIYLDGFAHANPVPAACRIGQFLVSGPLTGRDPRTGAMPASLDAQVENVFVHVRKLMQTVGGRTDDIIKMTFLVAEYRERDGINREWTAMFPNPHDRPTRHCIAAQLDNGSQIQCDVTAVLADQPHTEKGTV
ncbi:RidA family protein [Paramicrobacterium chengjingii]|uniref:RidA family protein n=1 Tax=Paramicrobacterium chengjingii TaxID=2769067 RepID=UPI0014241CAD|nr:RidA family protein [Microbacterium chengjingii]